MFAWVLPVCHCDSPRDCTGAIRGVVLDTEGQRVARARVHAATDGSGHIGGIQYVTTDNDGAFTINNVRWGVYKMFAMKPEDGYPDASFEIYSSGATVRAEVSPSTPTAFSMIVVAKAATMVGAISDAISGAPLSGTLHMWEIERPNVFLDTSVSSPFQVPVPAGKRIGIEIRVRGYETWQYVDPQREGPFKADDRLKVEVRLRRASAVGEPGR